MGRYRIRDILPYLSISWSGYTHNNIIQHTNGINARQLRSLRKILRKQRIIK